MDKLLEDVRQFTPAVLLYDDAVCQLPAVKNDAMVQKLSCEGALLLGTDHTILVNIVNALIFLFPCSARRGDTDRPRSLRCCIRWRPCRRRNSEAPDRWR